MGYLALLALVACLVAGIRYPGALLAGCFVTYQAGAISGIGLAGSIYVAAAAGISILRYWRYRAPISITNLDIALGILLIYLGMSLGWSPSPVDCIPMFGQLLLSVGGMYAIARLPVRETPRNIVLQMMLAAVLLETVMCLCMLSMRITDNAHEATRLYISNEDASAVGLSQPLPFGLLFATMLAFFARRRLIALGALGALAIIAYCSLVSATRSVFLAYGLGLAGGIFLARRQISMQRYMTAGVGLIVGVALMIGIVPADVFAHAMDRLFGSLTGNHALQDASSVERLYLWRDAGNMFYKAPAFGQGFGSFGLFSFFSYPHNMFVEIGSTTGLVGIALLLIWLGFLVATMIRVYRRQPAFGAMLIAVGLAAFAQMQVSFAFFMGRPLFLVCAIAAMLSSRAIPMRARQSLRPATPAMGRRPVPAAGLTK